MLILRVGRTGVCGSETVGFVWSCFG